MIGNRVMSDLPPHAGQAIRYSGSPVEAAVGAVILIHGRGATADDILGLSLELDRSDLVFLAPQAARGTWYPWSFLEPLERNEPELSSALAALGSVVEGLKSAGIEPRRQLLLGFSQGACLALEFAARSPRRYAGLIGLSGGLIGPAGVARDYSGSLDGTPVFLGSSDPDPHVPWHRVEESAEVLESMGSEVELVRYPGLGHTINRDELHRARRLVASAIPATGVIKVDE